MLDKRKSSIKYRISLKRKMWEIRKLLKKFKKYHPLMGMITKKLDKFTIKNS